VLLHSRWTSWPGRTGLQLCKLLSQLSKVPFLSVSSQHERHISESYCEPKVQHVPVYTHQVKGSVLLLDSQGWPTSMSLITLGGVHISNSFEGG
jgi:hypothetical protein